MKSTIVITNVEAKSYFPGYELTMFFSMPEGETSHVNLVFTNEGAEFEEHIWIECKEESLDLLYNRVCDSVINHPHVIDLRGLTVKVSASN